MNSILKKTHRQRQPENPKNARANPVRGMYSTGKKAKSQKQGFSERMSKLYMKKKKKLEEKRQTGGNEKPQKTATRHGNPSQVKPYDTRSRTQNNTNRKMDFKPKGRSRPNVETRHRIDSTRNGQERVRSMQHVKNKGYLDLKMRKRGPRPSRGTRQGSRSTSRTSARRRRKVLAKVDAREEINEEEEPSVENHLSIDGDDAKADSKPQSTSKPRVANLVSVDKIVKGLDLQKLEKPKQLVNLRQGHRNLKKTMSSSKVADLKPRKDFAKELSSLAPKDNKRIDEIINMMQSKHAKVDSFKDSVESILNESIERKQLVTNDYLSNTRDVLRGQARAESKHAQKRQKGHRSNRSNRLNQSNQSSSVRKRAGYYDRLRKKKEIKKANQGKIGISYLTPEMQKKQLQMSKQNLKMLSQRSQRSQQSQKSQRSHRSQFRKTGTILFNSKIQRKNSNNSIFSGKPSKKFMLSPTKGDRSAEEQKVKRKPSVRESMRIKSGVPHKKSVSRGKNGPNRGNLSHRRNTPNKRVTPKRGYANAKGFNRRKGGAQSKPNNQQKKPNGVPRSNQGKKVSPRIKIMNTKRPKHVSKFQRGKVKQVMKSTTSLSQKGEHAKKAPQSKAQRRQAEAKSKSSERTKENAPGQVSTPKKFENLNQSDHRKLDEIKKEFQKKFAIETKELNKKNQRAQKGQQSKKKSSPLPIMMKKISYSKSTANRQKNLRNKMKQTSTKANSHKQKRAREAKAEQTCSQVVRNLLLADSDTLFGFQEMVDEHKVAPKPHTVKSRKGNMQRKRRANKRAPKTAKGGIQNLKNRILRNRKQEPRPEQEGLEQSQTIAESIVQNVFDEKEQEEDTIGKVKDLIKSQREEVRKQAEGQRVIFESKMEGKSMKSAANVDAEAKKGQSQRTQTKSVSQSVILSKQSGLGSRVPADVGGLSTNSRRRPDEVNLVESEMDSNLDKASLEFSLIQSDRKLFTSQKSVSTRAKAKDKRRKNEKKDSKKRKEAGAAKKRRGQKSQKGAQKKGIQSRFIKPKKRGVTERPKPNLSTPKGNARKSKNTFSTPKSSLTRSKKSSKACSTPQTDKSVASGIKSLKKSEIAQRNTSIEQEILDQIFNQSKANPKEYLTEKSRKTMKEAGAEDKEPKRLKFRKTQKTSEVVYMSLTGSKTLGLDSKEAGNLTRQTTPKNSAGPTEDSHQSPVQRSKPLRPLIKLNQVARLSGNFSRVYPKRKSKKDLLSDLERVRRQKPLSKRQRGSVPKKFAVDYKEILNESKKSSGRSYGAELPKPITEVNPSNYNTLRSNQDFEQLELKLRGKAQTSSPGPKQLNVSELVESANTGLPGRNSGATRRFSRNTDAADDNEETPAQLRVSKTEFEPSLRSHFTSVKKEARESGELDQKQTLGRHLTQDRILRTTFEDVMDEKPRNLKVDQSVRIRKKHIGETEVKDLEEDLLRLKRDMEDGPKPERASTDAQSLSSLKVYKQRGMLKASHGPRKKRNLTFNKLAGIKKGLKQKTKPKKKMRKGLSGKLYSTMDDNITRQVTAHYEELKQIKEKEGAEATPETNLLQWRKNRIKGYGKARFKKESLKKGSESDNSPTKRKSTLSEIKKQWRSKKKAMATSLDTRSLKPKTKRLKEPQIVILVGGGQPQPQIKSEDFDADKFIKKELKTPTKSSFANKQHSFPNNSLVETEPGAFRKNNGRRERAPKTTVSRQDPFHISADSSFEWLMDDKGLPISDMDPSLMNSIDQNDRRRKANDSMRGMHEGLSEHWNRESFQRAPAQRMAPSDVRRSLGKRFRVKPDISVEIYGERQKKKANQSEHSADLMIENKLVSQIFDK